MSEFNYVPGSGLQSTSKPRVLLSKFGDGYEQRVLDGINTNLKSWRLSFTMEVASLDAIEAFLISKGGVTSFTWTPTGKSQVLVICRDWDYTFNHNNVRTLNCTFDEVPA
jgi:phage-related protein